MAHSDEMEAARSRRWVVFYALAAVAVLFFARAILIPVALAILLTFLLAPVVVRLQARLRSRVLAVAIVTAFVIGIAGGVTLLVGHQFMALVGDLPVYRATLVSKVRSVRAGTGDVVGEAAETIRAIGEELKDKPANADPAQDPQAQPDGASLAPPGAGVILNPATTTEAPAQPPSTGQDSLSLLTVLALPTLHVVASAAIVILLLILMLASREGIRDRVIRLAGLGNIGITTQALDDAGSRVGKYLGAHLLINAIYAVGITIGLMLIGVPNAAVCGLMAGLLRFIPMLGSWLGAVIPVVISVAVFDDWSHAVLVVLLFALLEAINNVVLEPWLYGTSTGLSSLGVVLAIIFWTWIWGPIGLVLAVPITVCLVVFSKQVPQLGALSILLGDEQVLADPLRFYQRLLCNNETDAAAILATAPTDTDPADILDQVVIPGLVAARTDLIRGLISNAQADRIARATRDLVSDWLDERGGAAGPDLVASRPVLCAPASDEFDAAAGAILSQLLERRGINAVATSSQSLLSESLSAAQANGAVVLIVSSIQPQSSSHLRRLTKTIARRLPGLRIVVGAWGEEERELTAVASDPASIRVRSLKQAVATIVSIATTTQAPSAESDRQGR